MRNWPRRDRVNTRGSIDSAAATRSSMGRRSRLRSPFSILSSQETECSTMSANCLRSRLRRSHQYRTRRPIAAASSIARLTSPDPVGPRRVRARSHKLYNWLVRVTPSVRCHAVERPGQHAIIDTLPERGHAGGSYPAVCGHSVVPDALIAPPGRRCTQCVTVLRPQRPPRAATRWARWLRPRWASR